jgi:hypothetical protein
MGKPKEVNMAEKKVKIKVSGYLEMSQENFDMLMSHDDQHTSLIYAIHMGYTDASTLEFTPLD